MVDDDGTRRVAVNRRKVVGYEREVEQLEMATANNTRPGKGDEGEKGCRSIVEL